MSNKKTTTPTAPMIHIGSNKDTVREAGLVIDRILASPSADAAKIEALKSLSALCAVSGTTSINNCQFTR